MLLAALATFASPAAALGADVTDPVPPPADNPPLVGQPADDEPGPLTAEQRRTRREKLSRATVNERGSRPGTAPQYGCPYSSPGQPTSGPSDGSTLSAGCSAPYYKILPMYARQQVNCSYCGPATGQVIINHTWWVRSTWADGTSTANNSHDQWTIASYMWTSWQYGTSGGGMQNGLNSLARLPWAGFFLFDAAGSGAQWHSKVITDVADYNIGLAAGVAPWEAGSAYRLSSWSAPSYGVRHWIAIRGYWGYWDGTRRPLIYYSDSAAGCGAGSTGNFSDPSLDVWVTIQYNTGNIVW